MLFTLLSSTVTFRSFEIDVQSFVIATIISFVFLVIPILFGKMILQRQRLVKAYISAQYETPLKLSPAEFSYLFNAKLKQREVAATIIDLTQRGLIHLKSENGSKRVLAGPKIEEKLKPHENIIVNQAEFKNGASSKALLNNAVNFDPNLENSDGIDKHVAITKLIKDHLIERGLMRKDVASKLVLHVIRVFALLLVTLVWVPLSIAIVSNVFQTGFADFGGVKDFVVLYGSATGISVLPVLLLTMILIRFKAKRFGRQWAITPKLARHWTQVVGFRNYVQLGEVEMLRYKSKALKKSSDANILPYSVALGFVRNWQKIVS